MIFWVVTASSDYYLQCMLNRPAYDIGGGEVDREKYPVGHAGSG